MYHLREGSPALSGRGGGQDAPSAAASGPVIDPDALLLRLSDVATWLAGGRQAAFNQTVHLGLQLGQAVFHVAT